MRLHRKGETFMNSKLYLSCMALLVSVGIIALMYSAFFSVIAFVIVLLLVFANEIYRKKGENDLSQEAVDLIKSKDLRLTEEWQHISKSNDNMAFIYQEFSSAIKSFQNSIKEIKRLANVVIETASESSDISKSMTEVNLAVSQGAQEQASDAENSSRSTSDLSDQFELMLVAISNMDKEIESLQSLKEQGNIKLSKTIDSSNVTKEELTHVIKQVEKLKESVNEINRTTSVINDIAGQTNLLSLNASIEAARAGELGKGFAVVSNEIRKLSDQSFSSVEEIEKIIADVNQEFSLVVDSIQVTYEKFENQHETIEQVNTSFDQIDANIYSLSTRQGEIRKQMSALDHARETIMSSVTNIAAVAQETAASTEEAASLSMQQEQSNQALFDLSNTLEEVVAKVGQAVGNYQVDHEIEQVKKIGFVSNLHKGHPFTQGMVDNARKMARKYGYEFVDKHVINYQVEEQMKAINELVEEGIEYLILIPSDVDKLSSIVNELAEQQIQTICIDSDIPESKRISYIGTDNFEAGKNIGKLVMKILQGRGKVLISATNIDQYNLSQRFKGLQQVLKDNRNIEICAVQSGINDYPKRLKDIEKIYNKHNDIDIMVGLDSDFGNVISHHKFPKGQEIKYIGFDNNPDNIDHLNNGLLEAVVAQRQILFGEIAVKQFYAKESGKQIKQSELLSTYVINQSNARALAK